VLGNGVLSIYPPENKTLAGAVTGLISEVPPESHPSRTQLVARNRVISGMCEAVIVVQTDHDGGAMHAARRAFEQKRRVFTLDMDATGNQMLAGEGATLLPDADAMIEAVAGLEECEPVSEETEPMTQLPLI